VPVLDTQVNGAARNGAPCNNVVRTMLTAKSFAMILIMYRPFDNASMTGGEIIV